MCQTSIFASTNQWSNTLILGKQRQKVPMIIHYYELDVVRLLILNRSSRGAILKLTKSIFFSIWQLRYYIFDLLFIMMFKAQLRNENCLFVVRFILSIVCVELYIWLKHSISCSHRTKHKNRIWSWMRSWDLWMSCTFERILVYFCDTTLGPLTDRVTYVLLLSNFKFQIHISLISFSTINVVHISITETVFNDSMNCSRFEWQLSLLSLKMSFDFLNILISEALQMIKMRLI